MHAPRQDFKLETDKKQVLENMPSSLKRTLSGGRAADYEYWHARLDDDGMNAPPWNAEGALVAKEVLDLMRREEAQERTWEEQIFAVLYYGDEWARFLAALPRRLAADTRSLIESIFTHHACSLSQTRAKTAAHKDARAISRRVLNPLRAVERTRVTISEVSLPTREWEVPTYLADGLGRWWLLESHDLSDWDAHDGLRQHNLPGKAGMLASSS